MNAEKLPTPVVGQSDLIRALGLLRDAEIIVFKYDEQSENDCNSEVIKVESGICEAVFAISNIIAGDIRKKSFYEREKS